MNEEALGTLWRWVDPRLARTGDGGVVVSALLAGLLADLAVRSGFGLAGAILVFVVVAAFLVAGQPASWQARGLIGAAAVFGGFIAMRTSPWLVPRRARRAARLVGRAVGPPLRLRSDVDQTVAHVVPIGLGAWGMAALLRVAAATPLVSGPAAVPAPRGRGGDHRPGFGHRALRRLRRHAGRRPGRRRPPCGRDGRPDLRRLCPVGVLPIGGGGGHRPRRPPHGRRLHRFTDGRARRRLVLLSEVVIA